MAEYKFIKDYSQWLEEEQRYETWEESVDRVMAMHRQKYKNILSPELEEALEFATSAYKDRLVLASQRSLQFGGDSLLRREERIYNCLTSYSDRLIFFQEAMHWLLCGGGVGFSVQKHHVAKLPAMQTRGKEPKTFVIPDSIEGWADAIGVLLSSYAVTGATFPEYQGHRVDFDYSLIRPEGSMISGGFKAPGPDGLRAAIVKIEELLNNATAEGVRKLRPIECYDIVMHVGNAVLSGGVRRSATICVFSPDDEEMLQAKTGDWFVKNPQRGRSNNSALLVRGETSKEEYLRIFESVKQFGEPGIVWADSTEFLFNPLKLAA